MVLLKKGIRLYIEDVQKVLFSSNKLCIKMFLGMRYTSATLKI